MELKLSQHIVESAVLRTLGDLRVEAGDGLCGLLLHEIVTNQPAHGANRIGVVLQSLLHQRRAFRVFLLHVAKLAEHKISWGTLRSNVHCSLQVGLGLVLCFTGDFHGGSPQIAIGDARVGGNGLLRHIGEHVHVAAQSSDARQLLLRFHAAGV